MGDQIVSREMMKTRGADAFKRRKPRDEHGMNPWAPGLADWLAGYDGAAAQAAPPTASHHMRANGTCLDQHQSKWSRP